MDRIRLNDGTEIPSVGLGVFMINDPKVCEETIKSAIDLGCRHYWIILRPTVKINKRWMS